MEQEEKEFALFIGGLRRDRKISFIKRKLIELFDDCLGITLAPADVNIIAPPRNRFAFVYLASSEEMESALAQLGSPQSRHRLAFDFNEIQKSRGLSVQVKFNKRERFHTPFSQSQQGVKLNQEHMDYNPTLRHPQLEPLSSPVVKPVQEPKDENSNEPKETDWQSFQNCASLGVQTPIAEASQAPMQVDVENYPLYKHTKIEQFRNAETSTTNLFKRAKVKRKRFDNIATSTTGLISPCSSNHSLPDKYLVMGQYLGNETRNVEFKRGGGLYMKKQLKDHVSKYVCSFLNAGEGGSLFLGVDDNGGVQGVECNQKLENDIRLLIDSVIKGIVPQVFPQQYSVTFVPVLELDEEHLTPIADVKVIEIHVEAVERSERLYETYRGDVYIRRDGSVQGPLKASDIQEWTRMMHRQEEKGRRGEFDRLQEELDSSRQRELHLLEQVQQLRKKRRSKACSIL